MDRSRLSMDRSGRSTERSGRSSGLVRSGWILGLASPVRGVLLDFNGSLSDDESLLCDLFGQIFSESLGIVLDAEEYFSSLAGSSDVDIVRHVLRSCGRGEDEQLVAEILDEKVRRYCREISERPRIHPDAVAFVRRVAELLPVGVVTGAVHAEVDHALEVAGLTDAIRVVVAGEDVERGKPDPQGYELGLYELARAAYALARAPHELARAPHELALLDAASVVVFEDSVAGLRAAKAAGMQCIGVTGTTDPTLLEAEAAGVVDGLTVEVAEALLTSLVTGDSATGDSAADAMTGDTAMGAWVADGP